MVWSRWFCNFRFASPCLKSTWVLVCSCFCSVASVVSDSSSLLCPWKFSGNNTGVGCQALLQEIFPTEGWTPHHVYLPFFKLFFKFCTIPYKWKWHLFFTCFSAESLLFAGFLSTTVLLWLFLYMPPCACASRCCCGFQKIFVYLAAPLLVVAHGIFYVPWGMWDLVTWPGWNPACCIGMPKS